MILLSRRAWLAFVMFLLINAGAMVASADSSFQAQLDKAWAAEQKGQYSTALELCNAIIYVHPSCAEAYYCRSKTNQEMRKYDSAMADCNVAISLNSNNPEYFCNRAEINYAKGDFQSAIKDCTQAIDLNAKFADGLRSELWLVTLKVTIQTRLMIAIVQSS